MTSPRRPRPVPSFEGRKSNESARSSLCVRAGCSSPPSSGFEGRRPEMRRRRENWCAPALTDASGSRVGKSMLPAPSRNCIRPLVPMPGASRSSVHGVSSENERRMAVALGAPRVPTRRDRKRPLPAMSSMLLGASVKGGDSSPDGVADRAAGARGEARLDSTRPQEEKQSSSTASRTRAAAALPPRRQNALPFPTSCQALPVHVHRIPFRLHRARLDLTVPQSRIACPVDLLVVPSPPHGQDGKDLLIVRAIEIRRDSLKPPA